MPIVHIIEKKKQGKRVRWDRLFLTLLEHEAKQYWAQMLEDMYQDAASWESDPQNISRQREQEMREKVLEWRAADYRLRQEEVPLSPASLIAGHWYRGHNPRKISNGLNPHHGRYPDRQIISLGRRTLQYDGPAVKVGQHYPEVSIPEFLLWATADVTGEWADESGSPIDK